MPKFYECGQCGAYHRKDFNGDCREDSERIYADELDTRFGMFGWEEVDMIPSAFYDKMVYAGSQP